MGETPFFNQVKGVSCDREAKGFPDHVITYDSQECEGKLSCAVPERRRGGRLSELRPKNWTQKQRFLVNSRARGLLGGPLVLELDRGQVA